MLQVLCEVCALVSLLVLLLHLEDLVEAEEVAAVVDQVPAPWKNPFTCPIMHAPSHPWPHISPAISHTRLTTTNSNMPL